MIQGPNDLPEIPKATAVPAAQPQARAKLAAPSVQPFQAEDSVQISPRAAQASQWLGQLKSLPDLREDRVQEVRADLSAIVKDSASLNAKLAEKLLTEN